MNKRGWLASGLLAAAVIGGYLGLLPLLSSLASGPAWPEPIATRDASGVVTAYTPLSSGEPNGEPAVQPEPEVVNETPRTDETGGAQPDRPAEEPKAVVVRVVGGGLERVKTPSTNAQPATNGGSSAGAAGGGSTGGGSSS